MKQSNYSKYRGKCKKFVDKICKEDSTLTPVRGHYICWAWGKQAHWWAIDKKGKIIDPTVDQFPKPHIGEYIPFDGNIECEECGKIVPEEAATIVGRHALCSSACCIQFLGI